MLPFYPPFSFNIGLRPDALPETVRLDGLVWIAPMEWLGLLLVFGVAAFIVGRIYTKRIDRLEAAKAAERERSAAAETGDRLDAPPRHQ